MPAAENPLPNPCFDTSRLRRVPFKPDPLIRLICINHRSFLFNHRKHEMAMCVASPSAASINSFFSLRLVSSVLQSKTKRSSFFPFSILISSPFSSSHSNLRTAFIASSMAYERELAVAKKAASLAARLCQATSKILTLAFPLESY